MKEFACAALPWVLAGIAVALICAASGCRKDGADKAYDERIAVGAALGLLFGVMLNGCGLWENHVLGIAIGPLGHGHRRHGRQGPPEGEKIE